MIWLTIATFSDWSSIEILGDMDKSWIDLPNRMSKEYMEGIKQFITFKNGFDSEHISYPYKKCAIQDYYT